MNRLKKVFLYFLLLSFIPGSFEHLYADNGWPTSFEYHYGHAQNPIKNMFEDKMIARWFNLGYNPDDRFSPLNSKWHQIILDKVIENSHEVALNSINQIKNCSAFNKLFGDIVGENLSKMENGFTYTPNLPRGAYGTVSYCGVIVSTTYLSNFLYHLGKQAKEIEEGQRTDFELTPEHFNTGWGSHAGIPINIAVPHELMHFSSGFNGGGRESECIVHCLTKKCIDSNHDFTEIKVEKIIRMNKTIVPIACDRITLDFWEGKEDIAEEMDAGDCFCGIQWVKDADCNQQTNSLAANTRENPNDKPDDHYSYAAGINSLANILSTANFDFPIPAEKDLISFSFFPDILIYEKYFYGDVQNLLKKYDEFYISDYIHDYFSNDYKVLFIGSAEIIGDEKSAILKTALADFVGRGGILLIFTQQYGPQIADLVPLPEGESLKFVGFRQDQACVKNSGYFTTISPPLSSSTKQLTDISLDGYFPVYPSNSTILLRRRINQEPALLYYPYKEGWVIAGANFTDYAASRSMSSTSELRIIRDLLSFARNPGLPILMVDLNLESNPIISRDVLVTNSSQDTAVKAILKVFNPDKNQVLFETQQDIVLNPGDQKEIPIHFSLPVVAPENYGIGHVFYELYDWENNMIYADESDHGRFALYKITEPYSATSPMDAWIVVKKEEIYLSEPVEFTFFFRNNTTVDKTLDLKFSWNHDVYQQYMQSLTIPGGEQVELEFKTDAPPAAHSLAQYHGGSAGMLFHLWYGSQQTLQFKQALKGVVFKVPETSGSIVHIQPQTVSVGKPFSYTIQVSNESDIAVNDTSITVILEQFTWPGNTYTPVKKIYETIHSLAAGETYNYDSTYTPDPIHESGMYRLNLQVEKPGGIKEEQYSNLYYVDSRIWPRVNPLEATNLMAGTTYPVHILLGKYSDPTVYNGRYSIMFKTPDGSIACRKDVENLVLTGYRTIYIDDVITFNPTVLAPYYRLCVEYSDETMLTPRTADSLRQYRFNYNASAELDKDVYLYRDTADVTLNIFGAGSFDVHFTCAAAGIDQQRQVTIPLGSVQGQEIFQVPIGLETDYIACFTITSQEGLFSMFGGQMSLPIPCIPLQLEANGSFGAITAQAGTPIEFELSIKGISGFTTPLPGLLKLSCMNYTDIKNISLLPTGPNNVSYTIPVPDDINAGLYHVYASFEHEGRLLLAKNFPIQLPSPGIAFSEPPVQLTCGDPFVLSLENPGGKNGNYQWEIYLNDQTGISILEYVKPEIFSINAGQKEEVTLTIPADAASGPYILLQSVKETNTGKEAVHYSPHQVTGISVTMDSYTSKEKYDENEPVLGKAEITCGSGTVESGQLQAGVVRMIESQGIEAQKPGEFIFYNMIENGYISGNMLYLVTDKGVLTYDVESGSVNVHYSFEDSIGFNSKDLLVSSTGEIWIASTYGIWKMNTAGEWVHYTTVDGLADNWIYDIMEVNGPFGPEIWAGSNGGISVYRNGNWVNYTTTEGLPANRVYRLAADNSGSVWVSSSGGVVRYNGTEFERIDAPFGTVGVLEKMTGTSDGSVWMATSTTLYRYQPETNTWNEWNLTGLYPCSYLYVHDMETVNGELWMKTRALDADGNLNNVLIYFDTTFNVYTEMEVPGLAGLNSAPVIPGSSMSGAGAYFACEVGCMAYRSGTWSRQVIDIDSNKFCGAIQCLTTDSLGRLWAGTNFGFSMYDGSQWTNYYATPGNQLITDIMLIGADTQNRVYGYCSLLGGIVCLADGNPELIPFPYSLGYSPQYDDKMAVDTQGRTWLGRKDLYYYDGQWHKFPDLHYIKTMIDDFNGGVWVGAWNDYTEFHLVHIKNDFTITDYTASNSGLLPWEKDRLYLDRDGILWIKNQVDNWNDVRSLQSFDGENWTDYSSYEGFPPLGVSDFVKDGKGKLWVVDPNGVLYSLQEDKFVLEMEQSGYSHSLLWWQESLRCAGYLMDGSTGGGGAEITGLTVGTYTTVSFNHFLTLSSASGVVEQELWSQNYNIDLGSGLSVTVDAEPVINPVPGGYLFKTRLLNTNGQRLCQDAYPFIIREAGISVSMTGDIITGKYVKPGKDVELLMECVNNTGETRENLSLTVKQQSPSGTETQLLAENMGLSPGEASTRGVVFNESETGTWRIQSELRDGSALLSATEMLVEVSSPVLSTQLLCPEYAGDESFDINVKISNPGKIPVSIECSITGTGTQETLYLAPGEENILRATDTISADKTYTVTLSGDIDKTESKTVRYGYVENIDMNVLPSYREGNISIGYQLSNQGGLPFASEMELRLFPIGAVEPLLTLNRSYNLYPGAEPVTDTFQCEAGPGNYVLKYKTLKSQGSESLVTVTPSGIAVITLLSPGNYPKGLIDIGFKIANTDTVGGDIRISIAVQQADQAIFSQTRNYYLQAGEEMQDALTLDLAAKGDYQLHMTGSKLSAPINTVLRVMDFKEIDSQLIIGEPEEHIIPASVSIINNGYDDFTGSIVMEVDGNVQEDSVHVASGHQLQETFGIETSAMTPGNKLVNIYLKDETGELLSQKSGTVLLMGADIQVMAVPQDLEIAAGSFAYLPLALKNQGDQRGEAVLKITALDTLFQERQITLDPGAEIEIDEIFVNIPLDLPSGHYPVYYTVESSGIEKRISSGNFNIKVNGALLAVEAALDRTLYNPGETALMTIDVDSETTPDASLEAVVNWGLFNETRLFNLTAGSTSLQFNIPLDAPRDEKVFYGIYYEGSKGIHLNDIYLHFRDEISVESDKQVYAPGELIQAVFFSQQPGELTVQAFSETYTLPVSGSASASFQVPVDTLGGTYGINWRFAPADPLQAGLSGSYPFDVSGLVVKAVKSDIEKGKYAPGETINAHYIFESNQDTGLILRCWLTTPGNEWEYLGESSITALADRQVDALTSYGLNTSHAGLHRLVYGVYREDRLVASGSMLFDVGDAVLTGIMPEREEYKNGDEPVHLTINYLGNGFAQMEVWLDSEIIHQQGISLDGTGSSEVILDSSRISGGGHTVKAVLTQGNLTSTKTTGFTYGSYLPDLIATLSDTILDGFSYTYKLEVANSGKTASPATSLTLSDNSINVTTVSIPALPPDNAYECNMIWNASGKAGSHQLVFEVDSAGAIKEFSENNNFVEITEEVPVLFYSLELNPPDQLNYPANTPINIITRLFNNQENPAQLTLNLSLTNNETDVIIYNRSKEEQIPGFTGKMIHDTFNTGVYPAGYYTLSQIVSNDIQTVNTFRKIYLSIEPTKIISGTLQVTPQQITANLPSDVQLEMILKNTGNVLLADESLGIKIFNKDSGEVLSSEEMTVTIPWTEEISLSKTMTLNLTEGNYEIWLQHQEEIIALSELLVKAAIQANISVSVVPRVFIMHLAARGGISSNPFQTLAGKTNTGFISDDFTPPSVPSLIGGGCNPLFEKTAPLDPWQKLFIELLEIQRIDYEIGEGVLDSYVKFHRGQANVTVVCGNEMGQKLLDELKERIYHGEGLILLCDKPAQNPEWTDFLGVTTKPVPGNIRENIIHLLPTEFSSEADNIECTDTIKLQMIKKKDDVVIIALTKQKQYPVMIYRKYGKGHILAIAVPLQFETGEKNVSQLLLNVITKFSQDIYSGSDLTRILPIELALKNESGEEKSLQVKLLAPYGVEIFDCQPQPEDNEELQWEITIAGSTTKTISYWTKLPDQVNTFEITAELHKADRKLDEVSICFNVTQAVLYRLNELLLELESIDASGKDLRLLRQAVHHLEQLRSRPGNSFMVHLLNLHDSVKAAAYLREVTNIDVSAQRLNIQDIMIIMGRRFYDAVKTWSNIQLIPILQLIKT